MTMTDDAGRQPPGWRRFPEPWHRVNGRLVHVDYFEDDPPPPPTLLWLYALNFFVLQWFGVRLQRAMRWDYVGCPSLRYGGWHLERWSLRRWVLPLTGWWSRYVETRGAR
jgi:hypothetical protein